MNLLDTLQITATIILSVGGGGAIVIGLSSYLGKIWAQRILAEERHKHDRELAELRAKLEKSNEQYLHAMRTELEISKDTFLKYHNDKIAIYGVVSNLIAEFMADLDLIHHMKQKPDGNPLDRFNRGRLKAHGQLAMLAPQDVMDAYDALVGYIFDLLEKPGGVWSREEWKEIRQLTYTLINRIRHDVGIDKTPVEYRGKR